MLSDEQKNEATILFYRLADELRSLGYQVLPILGIKFSSATKCFGSCQRKKTGRQLVGAIITISEVCWHAKDYSLKSTVLHELIHAMADTHNHGALFQRYAKEISTRYHVPIATHANNEEWEAVKNDGYVKFSYIIKCKKCGAVFEYLRRSKFVTAVMEGKGNRWHCGKCRGNDFALTSC